MSSPSTWIFAVALAGGCRADSAVDSQDGRPLLVLDDTPGFGLTFDGVGAISGGGATSRLLYDYDPAVASDILDYLFKPNFGLSLHMLKVEIGGNADATEGAEPSHMHDKGDENYQRGYEWWLMKEAKKRNPAITLYGLPWAWPGWLDEDATADRPARNVFNNLKQTANYTVQWILGAKRVHGLEIDYVGQWNERDAPPEYAKELRAQVKQHTPWTKVVDRMGHYMGNGDKELPRHLRNVGAPNSCLTSNHSEASPGWDDEEGSTGDREMENQKGGIQDSSRCLARVTNRAYVQNCYVSVIQWYLIESFYSYLPWTNCGLGTANTPWSGHYDIQKPLWALAHTTQFSEAGWKYLRHDSGVGLLPRGGSYVTRMSPDGKEWSMVVEKMDYNTSRCTRGQSSRAVAHDEVLSFQLEGSLRKANVLQVWYSDLNQVGDGPSIFKKLEPLEVHNGQFRLEVKVGEIFTLTTRTTGQKGHHQIPPAAPFPKKFSDNFDDTPDHHPPRYWFDQMGAWEVQPNPKGSGKVMRQVATVWPVCWGYSCSGPKTMFAPDTFQNTKVTFDILMEDDAKFMINDLEVWTNGTWTFGIHSGHADFRKDTWHTIKYTFKEGMEAVHLDGHFLAQNQTVTEVWSSAVVEEGQKFNNFQRTAGSVFLEEGARPLSYGHAGLKMALSRYVHASVDNLKIEPFFESSFLAK